MTVVRVLGVRVIARHGPGAMPPSLAYLTSRWAAASAATTWRDALRVTLVATFHMAALVIMLATEFAPEQKGAFILTWGVLNFFWLMLLRRPGIAGALSLAMVVALIQVSEFKYGVIWTTANFVDLMIIDPDTITFLLTIFPQLMPMVLIAVGVSVPALVIIWSFDPFRVRRLGAAAGMLGCLAGLYAVETVAPMEEFEGFYGKNYVSHFARSGVEAISTLVVHGLMESDPVASERLAPIGVCEPTAKPPHIILVHDESIFRHPGGAWHSCAAELRRPLPLARRQAAPVHRRRHRRPELVHRIQCARRPLGALLRAVCLFRHPHCGGPGRARPAAGAAPLRLRDLFALSGPWRVHERRPLPEDHRHPAFHGREGDRLDPARA